MNALNDALTKHVFSKAKPTTVSRFAEIVYGLSSVDRATKVSEIMTVVIEEYSLKYDKCPELRYHYSFLKKLRLIGETISSLDTTFGAGCYGDEFSNQARYVLAHQLYVHSKVFRDYILSLWSESHSESKIRNGIVLRHTLNETARTSFYQWVNTLMLSEEFAGQARPSVWVRRESLLRMTTDDLWATLLEMLSIYGENHLFSAKNFESELLDRVFHGLIWKLDIDTILRQLKEEKIISTHRGKEYKVFVQILDPNRLREGTNLKQLLQGQIT